MQWVVVDYYEAREKFCTLYFYFDLKLTYETEVVFSMKLIVLCILVICNSAGASPIKKLMRIKFNIDINSNGKLVIELRRALS